MVGQLSRPSNPGAVTKRVWQLTFRRSDLPRKVDEFTYDAAAPVAETKELASIEIVSPVTVQKLAQALKVEPSRLVEDLFGQNFTFRTSRDEVPEAVAREVSLKHGVALTVKKPIARDTSVPTISPPLQKSLQGPELFRQSQAATLSISPSPDKTDREADLVKYLYSPRFPRFGRAVDQYLAILGWILDNHPQGKHCLLAFKRGRRRYFATTAEEIEQRAASPNVKPIGATGLHALTTTDTPTKRGIVAEIMKCCGFGLDARERATQSILS